MMGMPEALHERPNNLRPATRLIPCRLRNQRHVDHGRPPILRQIAVDFGKTPDVAYHFEQDCGRVWQGEP